MRDKQTGLSSIRLFKNLAKGEFIYVYDKRTKQVMYCASVTYFKKNDKGHYEFVLWINWDNDAEENFLYTDPLSEVYENDVFYVTTMKQCMQDFVEKTCGKKSQQYIDMIF